ncbi:MAG: hypothetical protein WD068_00175 [Candidatus Babeliales bacterium]
MKKWGALDSAVALITAIAALHIGLAGGFGVDLLHGPLIQAKLHQLIRPVDIVVGLAGLYSLVMFFVCLFGGDDH